MKVFVYDPDLLSRERLERIVTDNGHEAIVHRGDTPLIAGVLKHRPHILIIHRQTPNFADICHQLSHNSIYSPAIIVIGDKASCGLELFKMGIADYLVSPISKEELTVSLKKVCKPNAAQEFGLTNTTNDTNKSCRQYIAARTHRGVELITMSDVYYFTADQKYVKVRHKGGIVLIDEALKDLEQEFEGVMFRIHRNALINLDYLDLLEAVEAGQYRVRFRGIEESLAVSRRHLPTLREKISKI